MVARGGLLFRRNERGDLCPNAPLAQREDVIQVAYEAADSLPFVLQLPVVSLE